MHPHGYSESIHHALAFCAKHHPGPVSRYDGHNPLLSTASVAVILARHQADDVTIVAAILKHLIDASPQVRVAPLHQNIARRFGGMVAAAVEAAAEPRFDPLGRERTWKASRFEALARLSGCSARVADIWIAAEIHTCGMALTDIRRLGVEYARTATPAPPEDLLWWHSSVLEVLGGRDSEARPSLQSEFRQLSREVAAYLSDDPA
ncbi:MAG TPA: HD domain-containing protein [Gemmatimonadales bacterium]|nr:HD domain-containing protein [Gemmatimonadales bacterium]